MKLTYQTGIAALIQFIVLSFLTLGSQIFSVVDTCRKGGECVSNLITSTILYILVAIVFGSIWLIGVAAQTQRSKRWAQLLICIEGVIALISLFSLKLSLHGHKNLGGMLMSFSIFLIAVWIISLAFRLTRYEGQRIRTGNQRRKRQRHHTIS